MNNTESRSLLAIMTCVMLYLGYQQYLNWKYPDLNKPRPSVPAASESAPSTTVPPAATTVTDASSAANVPVTTPPLSDQDLTVETKDIIWRFRQDQAALASVTLKDFRAEKDQASGPIDLLDAPMPFQGTLDLKNPAPASGTFSASREGRTLKFWRDVGQVRITQEFYFPESGYGADLKVSFANLSQTPMDLTGGLWSSAGLKPKKASSVMGFIPGTVTVQDQAILSADGSATWKPVSKLCEGGEEPLKASAEPVAYFGIDRHYFLTLIEPQGKSSSGRLEAMTSSPALCQVSLLNFDSLGTVKPGETTSLEYKLYFGPKDLNIMTAHNPALQSAMHLGMFDFIAKPLLMVIEGFHKVLGNYGLAIVLLTVALKILFYPLVRASSVSMHRMKKLNPEMQALREKWKDDKQRQQQELIRFMAQHKINPMKGCLPILPQIPVFFAFYQVLQNSISLRHAPFFGWIQDLSVMDPYIVTPLLMGVAMFVQQKLTPTTGMDKTQEKILMFMPIMFTAMMLTLPAGLTLYMLTNTVVGIAQQKWLYLRLDKLEA